jgi:hypothetical protein
MGTRSVAYATLAAAVACIALLGSQQTVRARFAGPDARPAGQVDADRLAEIALTEADLPGNLQRVAEQSGPIVTENQRGYFVVFTDTALFDPERLQRLPAGTLLGVMCDLAIPVNDRGPEEIEDRARTIQAMFEGSGTVDPLDAPAVGEDSRAYAIRLLSRDIALGAQPRTTTAILLRREGAYAVVYVTAHGEREPLDEALRLGRLLDERLQHAAGA